jgi:hypothetical protein
LKQKRDKELQVDFQKFENCPIIELVPRIKMAIVAYWRDSKGRNEPRVADAWWGTY